MTAPAQAPTGAIDYPLFASSNFGAEWIEQGGVSIEEAMDATSLGYTVEKRRTAYLDVVGVGDDSTSTGPNWSH